MGAIKEFWWSDRNFYPSLFRVLIGLLLLIDLGVTYDAAELLFDSNFNAFLPDSYWFETIGKHSDWFFMTYALVLIFFIVGIGRNITSFLVFLFYMVLFQFSLSLMTWGDKILKFSLLYFIFVDSFNYLSLNRTIPRNSYLSRLAVWSIILHLFLIYLNNAWYKLGDSDWQNGYAVFFGFSQYFGFEDSLFYPILSNEWASKWIAWTVVLQQLLFVPLVLIKRSRLFMILVSVMIHLIMIWQFGLWKFELIVILHYGFLLNDDEWRHILKRIGLFRKSEYDFIINKK